MSLCNILGLVVVTEQHNHLGMMRAERLRHMCGDRLQIRMTPYSFVNVNLVGVLLLP